MLWTKFKALVNASLRGPALYVTMGVVIAGVFLALLFAVIALEGAQSAKAEVKDLRKEIAIRTQSQEEIRNEVNRTKTQLCKYVLSHEKTLELPKELKADCFPVVRTTDYEDQINPDEPDTSPRVDAPQVDEH